MATNIQPSSNTDFVKPVLTALKRIGRPEWAADSTVAIQKSNPTRTDNPRRLALIATPAKGAPVHVTISRDLRPAWEKISAFSAALPSLAARPLYLETIQEYEVLTREFISGHTLHELLEAERLPPEKATALARSALQILGDTTRESTITAAQAEASTVFHALELLPTLHLMDRAFIREILAPSILDRISQSKPATRWTNGDFTPRNLILANDGSLRLIDYEFAGRTHFPDDIWRWDNLCVTARAPKLTGPEQHPAWLEIFFWCRQLLLSHQTTEASIAAADSPHAIFKILALAEVSGIFSKPKGLFLDQLALAAPLKAEIARAAGAESALSNNIIRMRASFSWRCTAWLRAIRRFLS